MIESEKSRYIFCDQNDRILTFRGQNNFYYLPTQYSVYPFGDAKILYIYQKFLELYLKEVEVELFRRKIVTDIYQKSQDGKLIDEDFRKLSYYYLIHRDFDEKEMEEIRKIGEEYQLRAKLMSINKLAYMRKDIKKNDHEAYMKLRKKLKKEGMNNEKI